MKIALVHDYLREYGGAERVVEALHEIWPNAPLYTSFVDWVSLGEHAKRFKSWDIRTSWAQHNWLVKKFHSPLRFLAPKIWESFDLSDFDLVITSSGWFICRGVKAKQQICYIHHPPRNLYGYATGRTFQKYALVRVYASIINFFMRQYDYKTAQKVDYFIANSQETARRVKKFYRRDSTVIYPPIPVSSIKYQVSGKNMTRDTRSYYLSVGRLVASKQTELAIWAANARKFPLKIVGTGPEDATLRAIAGPTVEFLGSVSDEELVKLYRGAKATIFSALDEDFGMVPVESMAQGTPVIALRQGGVVETIVEGETGMFFDESTVDALTGAMETFNKTYMTNKTNETNMRCIKQAQKFSKERFKKDLHAFVQKHARVLG